MKIPENKVSELIKEKDKVYFENLPEEMLR